MNKKIEINPALFSVNGFSKTKKNREKINSVTPIISPNILKNKLLKRIKQHKLREITTTDTDKLKETKIKPNLVDVSAYTNEFNESLDYLQNLSKQQKIKTDKTVQEKAKQDLERKTLKNYHSIYNQDIQIDLPDELKDVNTYVNEQNETFNNPNVPYDVPYDVPYGNLKGGTKPTYRVWNKTLKNVSNPNVPLTSFTDSEKLNLVEDKTNDREKRLNELKEKIKQNEIKSKVNEDIWMKEHFIQKPETDFKLTVNSNNIATIPTISSLATIPNVSNIILNDLDKEPTRKVIHKTIRRKYTIGKSKIKNTVSVLLKDRKTRKNVISAHKDLQKKQLHDVKNYLRDHNLIKVGSDAPNDVIRKIYENAMMSGEITNINKDTLLENFMVEN